MWLISLKQKHDLDLRTAATPKKNSPESIQTEEPVGMALHCE